MQLAETKQLKSADNIRRKKIKSILLFVVLFNADPLELSVFNDRRIYCELAAVDISFKTAVYNITTIILTDRNGFFTAIFCWTLSFSQIFCPNILNDLFYRKNLRYSLEKFAIENSAFHFCGFCDFFQRPDRTILKKHQPMLPFCSGTLFLFNIDVQTVLGVNMILLITVFRLFGETYTK